MRALKAGKRQGTILVENGAIRSRDLIEGVTEQVQEIVYSLFRWEDGEYELTRATCLRARSSCCACPRGTSCARGSGGCSAGAASARAWADLVQHYALSPDSGPLLGGLTLSPEEVTLVATLDGVTTPRGDLPLAAPPDFAVCRTVWGLWAAGVLDRVPQDTTASSAEETEPNASMTGASVGREIDRFNQLHRMLFELVTSSCATAATSSSMPSGGASSTRRSSRGWRWTRRGARSHRPSPQHRGRRGGRYLSGLDRLLEIERAWPGDAGGAQGRHHPGRPAGPQAAAARGT